MLVAAISPPQRLAAGAAGLVATASNAALAFANAAATASVFVAASMASLPSL